MLAQRARRSRRRVFLWSFNGRGQDRAPSDRRRFATKRPFDSLTPVCALSGAAQMYEASKRYLTVSAGTLVVAIIISLAAIIVRGVVVPGMDGKIAADGTVME